MRILIFSILLLPNILFGQKSNSWSYELEFISESDESSYILKVWTYSKRPKLNIEQAKKSAIHGIIFRGVKNHPAYTNDLTIENTRSDFFDAFFKNGALYSKYIISSGDGLGMGDIVKTEKGYKMGLILQINHSQLRKDLESQGIIKGLNNGF
jgi:hypothetical protein